MREGFQFGSRSRRASRARGALAVWWAVAALATLLLALTAPASATAAPSPIKPSLNESVCNRTIYDTRKGKFSRRFRKQMRADGAVRRPFGWLCIRPYAGRKTGRLVRDLGRRTAGDRSVNAVAFPKSLNNPVIIKTDNGRIWWNLIGAARSNPQTFADGSAYSTSQFDVVNEVALGELKESIVVYRHLGRRTWQWRLGNDFGYRPTLNRKGEVQIGETLLRRPFITNAGGTKIRNLSWRLRGSVLSVTFDDRKLPLPYVLDPSADYPQWLYLDDDTPGTVGSAERLCVSGAPGCQSGAITAEMRTSSVGEGIIWSGRTIATNDYNPPVAGGLADGAPYGAIAPANHTPGSVGWAHSAFGAVTLPSGGWAVQARVCPSDGFAPHARVRLMTRVLKVTVSGGTITSYATMHPWTKSSATGYQINICRNISVSMPAPHTQLSLAPNELVYIEIGLDVTETGSAGEKLWMVTDDAAGYSFISFGGAGNTNTPPIAPTLTIDPVLQSGFTSDTTPTFSADLNDPDSPQHAHFEVYAGGSCSGGPIQTGNSATGQVYNSTNNTWTTAALADGTYCARARIEEDDPPDHTQTGPYSSSLVFQIDTTGPTAPATVNDGLGADVNWTTSTTTLSANWSASSDGAGSGIDRYQYCITTSGTGANCGGGAMVTWTDNGLATNVTRNGLALTQGTTYYVCIRGVDELANNGGVGCSFQGIKSDNVAPAFTPGSVIDGLGADIEWNNSNTTISSNWSAVVEAQTLVKYEYCIATTIGGNACTGGIVVPWTNNSPLLAQTFTRTGLGPLTQGTRYYTCIRATDAAGNQGSQCSNGQRIDSVNPVTATVADGPGADLVWFNTGTQISANWTGAPGGDATSGLDHYDYCVTTSNSGADCTAGAIVTWAAVAPPLGTTINHTGLALVSGTTYYECVRSTDLADNSAFACSNGQVLDLTAPGPPTPAQDGLGPGDLDWSASTTTMSSNWTNPGAPDLARYDYCLTTSSTGADCAGAATKPWTSAALSLSQTSAGLTLVDGTLYYSCARAVDVAANISTSACSDGMRIDASPPTTPTVLDGTGADVAWFTTATEISANWTGAPGSDGAGSGLDHYQYCVTMDSAGANCAAGAVVTWTNTAPALATTVTRTGLALVSGNTYYVCVRAYDLVNNNAFTCSDGQVLDTNFPTGDIVLTEDPSPLVNRYTHLGGSPDTIYVSAGAASSFGAEIQNASAPAGIKQAQFPSTASIVPTPAAPILVAPYTATYAVSAGAATPAPFDATLESNTTASTNLPINVIVDGGQPTGGSISYGDVFQTATTHNITFSQGTDASSGLRTWQLQSLQGTLSGGSCSAFGAPTNIGPADPAAPTYNATGLTQGSCYEFRLLATDNVDNSRTYVTGPVRYVRVDNTPPSSATVTVTAGANSYVPGGTPDTVYYNGSLAGDFTVAATGADAESAIGSVDFPSLGAAPWSPTTPLNDNSSPFSRVYNWTPGAVQPGPLTVSVNNNAGLSLTPGLTVINDSTAPPGGGSVDYADGIQSGPFDAVVSFTNGGADAVSGLARRYIERRAAPYTVPAGPCGAYGAWAQVGPDDPAGPSYTDVGVAIPFCYQYRYVEEDNVGNRRIYTQPAKQYIAAGDLFDPDPFDVIDPVNPGLPAITTGGADPACTPDPVYTSATPNLQWNATVDTGGSGLAGYDVYQSGTPVPPGVPTAAYGTGVTSHVSAALTPGAWYWGVRARDGDGNTTESGPSFLRRFRVDLAPPNNVNNVSPPHLGYTFDTTPTLQWSAADDSCLARVVVNLNGAPPAPFTATAGGGETSWTVPAALGEGAYVWSVTAYDSAGQTTTSPVTTFLVDTTPPTDFAITAPTTGQTVRGSVDVTWTASSDPISGLSHYEVWVQQGAGAWLLDQTVPAGTLNATVTGLVAGPYNIRVIAEDAAGHTKIAWSDILTTEVAITSFGPIPLPNLVAPADGTNTNVVPTVQWTWPDDGGPPPTDYDVYVGGALVGNVPYAAGLMSLAIPDPGDGTNIDWYVEQHDPYTGTVNSATWQFTLDRTPPDVGLIWRDVAVMRWPAATDPATPAASGVDYIEFYYDIGGGPVLEATLPAGATSYDISYLPDNTYQMWIVVWDRAGNSFMSNIEVFVQDTQPPDPFTLDAPPIPGGLPAITTGATPPACELVPTYASGTPNMTWTASADAGSGLDHYAVSISGSPPTNVNVAAPATAYVPPTPLASGLHTWSVEAFDAYGLSTRGTPDPMSVRVDRTPPGMPVLVSPNGNPWLTDTTPTFTWIWSEDNCKSRAEIYIDGAPVAVAGGSEISWTPAAPIAEGVHTWNVVVYDAAGKTNTAAVDGTFRIDSVAPAGITAINPPDGGNITEGPSINFSWSAGTETGSGTTLYEYRLDGGGWIPMGLATNRPNVTIHAGPHTWDIRVRDLAGNIAVYPFTFVADPWNDTQPPSAFNLIAPPDGSVLNPFASLVWQASTDFNGIAQYNIYIDGGLKGTVPGNTTSYQPNTGAGAQQCISDFDATTNNPGCLYGWTYPAPYTVGAHAGGSVSGVSLGFDSYETDRQTRSTTATIDVPAAGADLRFWHRYDNHAAYNPDGSLQSPWEGGNLQISLDGGITWRTTCTVGARTKYGSSLRCNYEVVEPEAGYTGIVPGGTGNPLQYQEVFAGDSNGWVESRVRLSLFSNRTIRLRFVHGWDACYTTMPAWQLALCPAGVEPSMWLIDNVQLTDPALSPGPHTWYVEAVDGSPNANTRTSAQTWTFIQP